MNLKRSKAGVVAAAAASVAETDSTNEKKTIDGTRSTPPMNGRVAPGGDGKGIPIADARRAIAIPRTTPSAPPRSPVNSASVISSRPMTPRRSPSARSVASSIRRSTIDMPIVLAIPKITIVEMMISMTESSRRKRLTT